MSIRKNILPRTIVDAVLCLLTLLAIPYVYWFEIFVVIPTYYKIWSLWFNIHWICGNFVTYNIISNLVAVVLCDTSIKGKVLPIEMCPDWRFCAICETIAPPRSWHCETCRTCILKRDHHCMFSGCCIGHSNVRYFLMFVLHTFLATSYCTYFNVFYLREYIDFTNSYMWLKLIFPLTLLVVDNSMDQFNLLVSLLLIIAMLFTGVLLYHHFTLLKTGQVTHEKGTDALAYDMGLKQNITNVLGVNWFKIWISPSIPSQLTHDGVQWKRNDTLKSK